MGVGDLPGGRIGIQPGHFRQLADKRIKQNRSGHIENNVGPGHICAEAAAADPCDNRRDAGADVGSDGDGDPQFRRNGVNGCQAHGHGDGYGAAVDRGGYDRSGENAPEQALPGLLHEPAEQAPGPELRHDALHHLHAEQDAGEPGNGHKQQPDRPQTAAAETVFGQQIAEHPSGESGQQQRQRQPVQLKPDQFGCQAGADICAENDAEGLGKLHHTRVHQADGDNRHCGAALQQRR